MGSEKPEMRFILVSALQRLPMFINSHVIYYPLNDILFRYLCENTDRY